MLSIDQLITALTTDQVKASIYKIADKLGLNTTAWQKLSPTRTVFAIVAELFAGFTQILATLARAGFLDYAVGGWLTLLAFFVYGTSRIPAEFAVGEVTINNAGGGDYSYDADDLQFLNPTTNKVYTNTEAVHVGPLATGVIVAIRALEQGSASTATPGQISAFVAASPQLSVTNVTSVIGDDEEQDPDLRDRCRLSTAILSPNGPAAAFQFVALTPTLNGGVSITRVKVKPAVGDGTIQVVVANASGAVSGTTTDPTTDLGKVFAGLNKWALTCGYTLILTSATAHAYAPTIDVWVPTDAGLTSDEVKADVLAKLTTYFAKQPISGVITDATGKISWRAVVGQVEAANDFIIEAKLGSEADVSLGDSEVPVLSAPTMTVHLVDEAA